MERNIKISKSVIKSKKALILVSTVFPYVETFLHTEIKFLRKKFDLIIIISNHKKTNKNFSLGEEVIVLNYPYHLSKLNKILSFSKITSSVFWREFLLTFKCKKFKLNIIKSMLTSLKRGELFAKHLDKIIQQYTFKHDVLIYSYWANDMAIGLALLQKKNKKIKTISRAHRFDLYEYVNEINYLPYRSLLVNQLSSIYCISNHGLKYIIENWNAGKNKHNLKLSKLGVTNNSFFKKKDNAENVKLISCSSLTSVKRIHIIIYSLYMLPRNIKITWHHVGEGPLDSELKLKAKNMIKNKNISFNFFGRIPNTKLYEMYNSSDYDLFVNTSKSEGLPVSIMEAQSFSVPVISSSVEGTPEIVNDENGYLLKSDDLVKELVKVIINYSDLSLKQINNKRKASYVSWKKGYNSKNNYKQFVEEIDFL